MRAHTRWFPRLLRGLLVASLAACRPVASTQTNAEHAASARNVFTTGVTCCAEKAMRNGLEFTARARVDSVGGELRLQVNVHVGNPGPTSASFVSSESNCDPPLRLLNEGTSRSYVWNFQAWVTADALARSGKIPVTACIGGAEGPVLLPGEQKDVAQQTYPVAVIRGDSMPPGDYRVAVPVRLYARRNGMVGEETMYVWSAPVILP